MLIGEPPWAHPRVCGENGIEVAALGAKDGSSPRVRGKPDSRQARYQLTGLIPACAGKTEGPDRAREIVPAHPRVCGENRSAVHDPPAVPGSSPRVRGKREQVPGPVPRVRLIPACAGKTSDSLRSSLGDRAHPRVCGENTATGEVNGLRLGSSPRVRGKRALRPAREFRR